MLKHRKLTLTLNQCYIHKQLTKLTNGGPLCRPHSSVGVKRASGRGSAPPEAGGVTISAPAQLIRLKWISRNSVCVYGGSRKRTKQNDKNKSVFIGSKKSQSLHQIMFNKISSMRLDLLKRNQKHKNKDLLVIMKSEA